MPDDRLIELIDAVLVDLDGSAELDPHGRVSGLLAEARDQFRDGQLDSGKANLAEAARVVVDEWPMTTLLAERVCEVSALAGRH